MSAILILGFGQLYPHPHPPRLPLKQEQGRQMKVGMTSLQKQSGQVGNEQTGGQRFAGMAAMSVCA